MDENHRLEPMLCLKDCVRSRDVQSEPLQCSKLNASNIQDETILSTKSSGLDCNEPGKENDEAPDSSDCSDLYDSSDEDVDIRRKKYFQERKEMERRKRDILTKLSIVKMTKEIQQAIDQENQQKKTKSTKLQLERQFRRQLRSRSRSQPQRKSLRLLNKDPNITALPQKEVVEPEEVVKVPSTEFALKAIGFENEKIGDIEEKERDEKALKDYNHFMDLLTKQEQVQPPSHEVPLPLSIEERKKGFMSLKISPDRVQKVTKSRIFSLAVHPSPSDILVAAGGKYGHLGLWKPLLKDSNNGTYLFQPHSKPISCMKFSTLNSNKLYTCSYDGLLRSLDLEKATFEQAVINDEDMEMSSFDFMYSEQAIVASCTSGDFAVYDTRVSKKNSVMSCATHAKPAKSISCHPLQPYFVASSYRDGSVFIFDIRQASKKKHLTPLVTLKGHSRSVSSAYFSPVTGSNIVTTCLDDRIRVFNTRIIEKKHVVMKASCRHNNFTGRWLSSFRATWHPDSDDVFVIGSMDRPRRIEIYDSNAKPLHFLRDSDTFTTVSSVNCFHKKNFLFGGNSSGKVYMFSDMR